MMYTDVTIFAREITNGSMAVGCLFVIMVFGRYIYRNWRSADISVTAAIAVLVLMSGHFVRAMSSWLEFIWLDLNLDPSPWTSQSWTWFIISAALVLSGKAMMLFTFSPDKWRKQITVYAISAAILVPLFVGIVIDLVGDMR